MRPLILSAIVSTAVAVAISQVNECASQASDVRYCTIETYVDTTLNASNPTSPTECQETCRGILEDAGDWTVDFADEPAGWIDNMVEFPCGFSVGRGSGELSDYNFTMSNQDIVSILDLVSTKFGSLHGGKVSATGTMKCDGYQARWYVK